MLDKLRGLEVDAHLIKKTAEGEDLRSALLAVASLTRIIEIQGKVLAEIPQNEAERKAAAAETSAEETEAFRARTQTEIDANPAVGERSHGSSIATARGTEVSLKLRIPRTR